MPETRAFLHSAPMEGHGAYNRHSFVQAAGSTMPAALLERAAALADLPDASLPIVIADYGCSQGANSLAPIGAAIRALRARAGPEREISVVHTDLPDIEFASLFRTLDESDKSYLRGDPLTFAAAVGRSFYGQILPTLTRGLDGGQSDRRAAAFIERMEAGMAARLAAAPQPMVIPLATAVVVKEGG